MTCISCRKNASTYFRSKGDQNERCRATVKMISTFLYISESHFHDAVLLKKSKFHYRIKMIM